MVPILLGMVGETGSWYIAGGDILLGLLIRVRGPILVSYTPDSRSEFGQSMILSLVLSRNQVQAV